MATLILWFLVQVQNQLLYCLYIDTLITSSCAGKLSRNVIFVSWSLLLCVAFTCFQDLCNASINDIAALSFLRWNIFQIGVCDHLCNVISTYPFSKSSIKVDWMIHFVHRGGKEQSSVSLFYFTCYRVFLKVLFNILLHYISLFSYFIYHYFIISSTVIILTFIHNLISGKIKFCGSL